MRVPRFLALVCASIVVLSIPAVSRTNVLSGQAQIPQIPTRRAADPSLPLSPPSLPLGAERVLPMTIELTVAQEPDNGRRFSQTVSRTADRIHLSAVNGREWLFERNIRDPRRVAGFLIDHPARTVVMWTESDLRMSMGIRGWVDVLSLGYDPTTLGGFTRTSDSRALGSARFTRYIAAPPTEHRDMWWSEEHLLALEVITGDRNARTRSVITDTRAGVDEAVLRSAVARFPLYRVVDVANWLEHR